MTADRSYSDNKVRADGQQKSGLADQDLQVSPPQLSPRWVARGFAPTTTHRRATVSKCDGEVMEILEAFDLSRYLESAARLAGCDAKTVQRYVARREAGANPTEPARRP